MYHYRNDRTVPKRGPSYHKNAEGPFYVSDQCITCGLPKATAPDNIDWDCAAGCQDCPDSCYVKRQAESDAERDQLIDALLGSEVENIRYCGTDSYILQKIKEAGLARVCDAL